MPLTIENQVIQLITERLRDHMVNGAYVVPMGSENVSTLSNKIALSGDPVTTYPRKFEIEVVSATEVRVIETTLWADLGNNHPAPIDEDIEFTAGTPFVIGDTGVSVSITSPVAGDSWQLRIGNAAHTVFAVEAHPFDYESLPTPSISVYLSTTSESITTTQHVDSEARINIVLCVDANTFESGLGYELIGDIRDCINRDRALWDNQKCLAINCISTNHELFDLTDSNSAIFMIEGLITYRSQLKNSRAK